MMELKNLKGVGEKTYNALLSKGIKDIPSLLYNLPTSYKEYRLTRLIPDIVVNVKAIVTDTVNIMKLKNVTKVSFSASVEGLIIKVVLFNQNYLKNIIHIGSEVVIVGKFDARFRTIEATKIIPAPLYKEGIFPEYNFDNINNTTIQRIIKEGLEYYEEEYSIIPSSYLNKYNYPTGKSLFLAIHFPKSKEDYENALSSLKYLELLDFTLRMSTIRKNLEETIKEPKNIDLSKLKEFISKAITFELTLDQKNAVNDIYLGMKSNHPLNMLLEGDVGSGKTIVSIISSYMSYLSGMQSLIIAPTEALARQHYNTFKSIFNEFGVNVALLTASVSSKNRNIILEDLKNGSIDIIIGTHSLLSKEVIFKNLGFIVCDEQHKFGVNQRKTIREKGINPDVLYMTATPIPRTLSLTLFGDMKLETIKTMPLGRKPIKTEIYSYRDYVGSVLSFVKKEISEGRQAYFVSPLIDENDSTDITSVIRIERDLKTYFKDLRVGLLHGRLSSIEKDEIINTFKNKEIDILVSTSVIEVGINNPNASVMVIIDAHNFGLSSLHQLRGRVGRGTDYGYCFLMVSNSDEREKLKILEETQDGFRISEEDLRQRGPGDYLGRDQSGSIKFKYANLFKDDNIFKNALLDSKELIKDDTILEYYQDHLYNDNFD